MKKLTDEAKNTIAQPIAPRPSRPRRRGLAGLRQCSALSRLDRAVSRRRDAEEPQAALHLRHARHADHRRAERSLDRDIRRGGNGRWSPPGLAAIVVSLMTALSAGDHLLMTDSAYQPARIFCDATLKRMGVETTYYDPLVGAGIAALMRANTKAVFVEAPGSQSLEVQDIPAIAASRPRARRLRHRRQHLGDAAVLFAARARRRHGGRGGHQISLRPFRSAARPRLGQRAMVSAARQDRRSDGDPARSRGRVSRAARPAHDGAAASRSRASGPRARALAQSAAGSAARHPPRPARRSRPRHLEARLFRLLRAVQRRVEAGARARGRGDARRARIVRHGLFLGRLREPRHPLRLHELPHRDALGAGRADPALLGRARGHRGLEGRPRSRLPSASPRPLERDRRSHAHVSHRHRHRLRRRGRDPDGARGA